MKSAYRWLAMIIAVEVAVQAAAIAFAAFGLFQWVEDGGVLNKQVIESDQSAGFSGEVGFMIHGINGQMIIPLLAIILLVVSFFAKVPGGVEWAVHCCVRWRMPAAPCRSRATACRNCRGYACGRANGSD